MYIPKHFEETDTAVLHALLRANPLGAWVTLCDGELLANHIPFLLDPSRGPHGTLVAHVARANPVWRSFSKDVASVVIFQGAQTYITPSWYPGKATDGKVVPTWNYAVVHGKGTLQLHHETDWIRQLLLDLTSQQESVMPTPWSVDDAPRDYTDALLRALVGIEIPLTSLRGKWKVSQNQPAVNQQSLVAALETRPSGDAQAMAQLVKERGAR